MARKIYVLPQRFELNDSIISNSKNRKSENKKIKRENALC